MLIGKSKLLSGNSRLKSFFFQCFNQLILGHLEQKVYENEITKMNKLFTFSN